MWKPFNGCPEPKTWHLTIVICSPGVIQDFGRNPKSEPKKYFGNGMMMDLKAHSQHMDGRVCMG
jgi:hypothetical protein